MLRGGFGIVYDRVNTISVILPAAFGIGFGQVLQTPAPLCNVSGAPGRAAILLAAPGIAASRRFAPGSTERFRFRRSREARHRSCPRSFPAARPSPPIPNGSVGRNYLIDFTVQREIPGNMIVEVGYIGRLGRDLPRGSRSRRFTLFLQGCSQRPELCEAYDASALALRLGATAANAAGAALVRKPVARIERIRGAACGRRLCALNSTQCLATLPGALFQTNSVNTLFLRMNQLRQVNLGLTPYNNLQLLAILMATHGGVSDYHAMMATVRNRPWKGIQFDVNYTLSNRWISSATCKTICR